MKEKILFGRAVCYSGYRENQSPKTKVYPTCEQILEDLNILVNDGYKYIRMYDANIYAENVCKVIRENKLPLQLMLGPGLINEVNNTGCQWNKTVYSDEELAERKAHNEHQIQELARIAKENPDVIFCVSVGNENTPDWGENTVPEERLIEYAKYLKKETGKLVTFNEGAREWKKLQKLVEYMDVICIHSYPLWYGLTVEKALDANKEDFYAIAQMYPEKQVLFSEAGWTTSCKPDQGMVMGQPSVENMKKYYEQFWNWTDSEKITAFMFEAFDEPWKGGNVPEEAEKHWGIYSVDRKKK